MAKLIGKLPLEVWVKKMHFLNEHTLLAEYPKFAPPHSKKVA